MNKLISYIVLMTGMAIFGTSAMAEVNINKADAETLAAELQGIGLNKARAIVAYRDEHGIFKHPDELAKVKGIGLRTVELNRENIRLVSEQQTRKD